MEAQRLHFRVSLGNQKTRAKQVKRVQRSHGPTHQVTDLPRDVTSRRDHVSLNETKDKTNLGQARVWPVLTLVDLPVGPACQEQGNYGSDRRSDPANHLHLAPPPFLGR